MPNNLKKNTAKQVKVRAILTLTETEKTLRYLKKETEANLPACVNILKNRRGKIVTCGIGKSSFVAMKMAATLASLGHEAVFLHPTDAFHGDSGIMKTGDVLVCFSFSGESGELVRLVSYFKETFKIKIISITGAKQSRLAKLSDAIINIKINKEGSPLSLAPMASITASLVASDMLVSAITETEAFSEHVFAKFHPGGSLGLNLKKVVDFMEKGSRLPLIQEMQSLKQSLVEMTQKGRGVVGVVKTNGVFSGVITDGDVRRFFLSNHSHKDKCAKDAMTKNPKTITGEQSLLDALRIMERHGITNLFVLDEKKMPIGLIHIHNILGQTVA